MVGSVIRFVGTTTRLIRILLVAIVLFAVALVLERSGDAPTVSKADIPAFKVIKHTDNHAGNSEQHAKHCTDGKGRDGEKNKHCRPASG